MENQTTSAPQFIDRPCNTSVRHSDQSLRGVEAYQLRPWEQLIENRRDTRNLTTKEFNYLLKATSVKGVQSIDKDLRQQVVVDAIMYYMQPGHEVPTGEGSKNLSYYLSIKARNLLIDNIRTTNSQRRGGGKVSSITDLALRGGQDIAESEIRALGVDGNPAGRDVDTRRIMQAILTAIGPNPAKLRLLELMLEGLSPAEIAEIYGDANSGRVRKQMCDLRALLAKIPGIASLRLEEAPEGQQWGPEGRETRPGRFVSSKECVQRQLELEQGLELAA